MPNDAELKRRDSGNNLQPWTLRDPATEDNTLYTDPVSEAYLRAFFSPTYITGTVTATGTPTGMVAYLDTSKSGALYVHIRVVANIPPAPPNFIGTIVVEGTNDPAHTDNWTALTLHSTSSGARSSSAKNGGIFLVSNLPRFVRVRCSAFTSGTATIDLMLKPLEEPSPARYLTDADGLARWQLTTFGTGIVTQKTFLCGGDFGSATTLPTRYWTDQSINGGSLVFANGEVELRTGTNAAGRARVQTLRSANFLGGNDNEIQIICRQGDTGGADHIFRFGIYDDSNGAFVEINSTGLTFKIRKNGVDTESPFGILGVVAPSNSIVNQFWYITFNPNLIIFRQGANFVQLQIGSANVETLMADTTLPVTCEALNLSGSTSHSLFVQTAVANRLGQPHTVRATEVFQPDDVLAATATVNQGQDPDGNFTLLRAGGTRTLDPVPTPRIASGIYQSTWMDTEDYPSLRLLVASDQISADNGIEFQWSDTSTGTIIRTIDTRSFRAGHIQNGRSILNSTRERYLRIKYTNGLTPQTTFFMSLRLMPEPFVDQVSLVPPTAGNVGQQDVTTVATALPVGLAGRKAIRIKNKIGSAREMYYGFSSGITILTGDELSPGQAIDLDLDEFVSIYVVTASTAGAGVRCSWTELA